MNQLLKLIFPELILIGVACILFLLGCSNKVASRRMAPFLALMALGMVFIVELAMRGEAVGGDAALSLRIDAVGRYVRVLTAAVGILLLLLAWPSNAQHTGNSAIHYGHDAGEFFALFLLSIAGLLLVTAANDLIVLFLALELTSIPTYVMVSMSRRSSLAQEAGVKYFFLGAMSVALMLFGFSYLYGTTGQINFSAVSAALQSTISTTGGLSAWQVLAVVLVLVGLAFKMAAFPLHFYAGDVYEGAATPVTAFLAYVPKTAGFVALLKLLEMVGGNEFDLPRNLVVLLGVIATLTMFLGNVLGLLQNNVKRVLAYSSIAHSGYMLVGVAALKAVPRDALEGVLFYLAAYGMMNAGAFGVLMLLPSRDGEGSAETFDDLAGQGRRHVGLGLAMAVSCFSLIGIPLTVGFIGKLLLIQPALRGGMTWLVVMLVINAAISAAYYLRIVGTMFLRGEVGAGAMEGAEEPVHRRTQVTVLISVMLSVATTLAFGAIPHAADELVRRAESSAASVVPVRPVELPGGLAGP